MGLATSSCWEGCFVEVNGGTSAEIDTLKEIHEVGNDLRRLVNIRQIQAISFLVDSTLSSGCDKSFSSSSTSSNEIDIDRANRIFNAQLQLMIIFSSMASLAHANTIQFTESAAWYCEANNDLDCCEISGVYYDGGYVSPQINASSCEPGLLEAACRIGYTSIYDYGDDITHEGQQMAVAILNSNAHSHLHKNNDMNEESPCHAAFPYRYAVGLHEANIDDMKRFASKEDHYKFISDSEEALTLIGNLFSCITGSCCGGPGSLNSESFCLLATGHTGEFTTEFDCPFC